MNFFLNGWEIKDLNFGRLTMANEPTIKIKDNI